MLSNEVILRDRKQAVSRRTQLWLHDKFLHFTPFYPELIGNKSAFRAWLDWHLKIKEFLNIYKTVRLLSCRIQCTRGTRDHQFCRNNTGLFFLFLFVLQKTAWTSNESPKWWTKEKYHPHAGKASNIQSSKKSRIPPDVFWRCSGLFVWIKALRIRAWDVLNMDSKTKTSPKRSSTFFKRLVKKLMTTLCYCFSKDHVSFVDRFRAKIHSFREAFQANERNISGNLALKWNFPCTLWVTRFTPPKLSDPTQPGAYMYMCSVWVDEGSTFNDFDTDISLTQPVFPKRSNPGVMEFVIPVHRYERFHLRGELVLFLEGKDEKEDTCAKKGEKRTYSAKVLQCLSKWRQCTLHGGAHTHSAPWP